MRTSGAVSGRLWWVINAALLLVSSFVLSSCINSAVSALSVTATSEPDVKIIHVLVVDGNNRPIKNAIIRVPGTDQVDDNDYEGYWLKFCIQSETLVVNAPDYQETSTPCDGSTSEYKITLQRLQNVEQILKELQDDPNYSWRSASGNCQACHSEYLEWQNSGHATSITDHYFETMYKGTAINGLTAGPGFRLDYSNEYGNCAYCHMPAAVGPSHQEVDLWNFFPALNGDARGEGITCDICHKVKGVILGEDHYPYSDRPGILSFEFGRSQNDPSLMIGPFLYPKTSAGSSTSTACSPVFSQSEFCAVCHYGKFYDTVIYNSYGEWRQSKKYSQRQITSASGKKEENKDFRSCQDCHMSSADSMADKLPIERDACSGSNNNLNIDHNVMQYKQDANDSSLSISALIKDAAELKVEFDPKTSSEMLRVIVKVTNTKVGHKFPTDSPLRHLLLVVQAEHDGNPLPQIDDTRIPNWGGVGFNKPYGMETYGGMPGKIFANLLVDRDTNLSPTAAYWKPTRSILKDSGDNRLEPDKTDESDYVFSMPSESEITVNVKLIYRYAFFDVAFQKNWIRPDVIVVSKQCFVDLRQIDLAECY